MKARNKKHVWARKFGHTLELKFIFRSVAKDGSIIHNVLHQDLKIKKDHVEAVDRNKLRKIEKTLEDTFVRRMQKINDVYTTHMTAKTMKRLNETGDFKKAGFLINISQQAQFMHLGNQLDNDRDGFKKKYNNILEDTELPINFKLRLKKGPAPR